MAKPLIKSTHPNTGSTFFRALAVFAVLCGTLLIILGDSRDLPTEDAQPESVKSVISEIDAAASALEDKDYGRTKAYLRSARKRLSRLDE